LFHPAEQQKLINKAAAQGIESFAVSLVVGQYGAD
jgi:hypothetical protein